MQNNNSEESLNRIRFLIKKNKNSEVIEILKNTGVNAMIHDLGSPLNIACIFDNEEIAEYCLQNGADVNAVDSSTDTPLIACCKVGNLKLVKKLLELGANVNAKNKYDRTPIARAISDHPENLELIEVLLQYGADPKIYEAYGEDDERISTRSAYEYAKQELNDRDLIKLLDKYVS
jgi:ankyrin repeat protein